MRATDSQCGVMATGKVLRQFGVPFTYMTNSSPDDEVFERTLRTFLNVAHVVKAMKGLRIGQISVRPDAFWSVKCNELQLLEKFGVEVVPVTLIEIQQRYQKILESRRADLEPVVAEYKRGFDVKVDGESLFRAAALKTALKEWAVEQKVSAMASNCWGPMRDMSGIAACFTFGELTDEGLPVVCETDVHGAIPPCSRRPPPVAEGLVHRGLTTATPPTTRELFWHCGVFRAPPRSCACKPCIAPNFDEGRPAVGNFLIEDSDVTLLRFDCSDDKYSLLIAEGRTVPGPETGGTYGYVEFKDWPKLEHKVVTGPYIHHVAGVHHRSRKCFRGVQVPPGLAPDLAEPRSGSPEALW